MKRLLLLGSVLPVVLGACMAVTNSDSFSLAAAGQSLAAPDIYQVDSNGWVVAHDGLPVGDFDPGGFAVHDGALYFLVDDANPAINSVPTDALYRYQEGRWELVARQEGGYSIRNLLAYGGDLYVLDHQSLKRLATAGDPGSWETVLTAAESPVGKLRRIEPHPSGILILDGDDTDPLVWLFDPSAPDVASGLTNTGSPGTGLDGKPHIDLVATSTGEIYYQSNYSGVFVYQGGSWSTILDRNGSLKIGVAADDSFYASYEIQPTTQISSFFRHSGGNWDLVQQAKGYGIAMEPLESGSGVVALSGRFSSLIVDPPRMWTLPNNRGGLRLTADETRSVRIRDFVVYNSEIFAVQSIPRGGGSSLRVIRLPADTTELPFYTAAFDLDWGAFPSGSENSDPVETAILADGSILVAYNTVTVTGAGTDAATIEPVDGVVHRYTESGALVGTTVLTGDPILDIDAHPGAETTFVIASYSGIYRGDTAMGAPSELLQFESDKKRVDVGASGTVAVLLDNSTVALLDDDGGELFRRTSNRSYAEDVAVSDAGGLVYTVGFDNKRLPSGNPVQVAYLEARNFAGEFEWLRFGFDGSELSSNVADTRLYHVEIGEDGRLYILGESAGTQTIFRYDGLRHSGDVTVTGTDFYNDLWNSGSAHISYHATLDPATGTIDTSQLAMTRLSDGKSNTLRARALAADGSGRIYVGGMAASSLANRDAQTIDGRSPGAYGSSTGFQAGADPSLLVVAKGYRQRVLWTTMKASDAGGGTVSGLAVRSGRGVVLSRLAGGGAGFSGSATLLTNDADTVGAHIGVFDIGANFED